MKLAQWYLIFLPIERCGLIRKSDLSYFGMCKDFSYGGCEGNGNTTAK